MKDCPMMIGKKANPRCMGEKCAWWNNYAKECSIPLIADILADSSICKNSWDNPELLESKE